jgi:hypothetical protein
MPNYDGNICTFVHKLMPNYDGGICTCVHKLMPNWYGDICVCLPGGQPDGVATEFVGNNAVGAEKCCQDTTPNPFPEWVVFGGGAEEHRIVPLNGPNDGHEDFANVTFMIFSR